MNATHSAETHRFEIDLGADGVAYLAYEPLAGDVLDLQHTIVPEGGQGRGVGTALVEAAFAHARTNGLRVVPSCPFVADWLEAHPEGADVVAG
jgi:predicted GNAT family acetyltransferase